MTVKNLDKKLKALAKSSSKQALDASQWRKDNRDWLRKSFEISIHVLAAIKARGWNQKQLAEAMGVSQQQVSKIVKGKENFTLQTIAALENILERKLIQTSLAPAPQVKVIERTKSPHDIFTTSVKEVFESNSQKITSGGAPKEQVQWTNKAPSYLKVA